MKKQIKKKAALLLVVCMVFSLFAGLPMNVYAEEGEQNTPTGLTVTGKIDWDKVDAADGAYFGKEETADLSGATFALKYNDETVAADKLSVTGDGECTIDQYNENLISFSFDKTGTYTISYGDNATEETDKVTITVGYPKIGFYRTDELSDDGYIRDVDGFEYESGKTAEFYIITNLNGNEGWTDFQYTVVPDWGDTSNVYVDGTLLGDEWVSRNGETAKITISENAAGNWGLNVSSSYTYDDDGVPHSVAGEDPRCYVECREKMTGLVYSWDWPDVEEKYFNKSGGVTPKQTYTWYFATINEGESATAYTGALSVKKIENGAAVETEDVSITAHKEEEKAVPGLYDVRFNTQGIYRISSEDGSFVTIEVAEINAGFFSSADISADSYINEQRMEYSENSNREFYFAYKEKPEDGISCEVVTGSDGMPTVTSEDVPADGVTITKVSTTGDYTIYKLVLDDSFEIEGDIRIQVNVTPEEGEPWTDDYYLGLSRKLEGLVYTWPEWSEESGLYIPDAPEYHKEAELNPLQNHTMYFGTMASDGNVTLYTGNLTIKKVNDDGTIAATTDGTILKHKEIVWDEEAEEDKEVESDKFYDVKFAGSASGKYRIYNETNSYVTVSIVEADAGFYSSDVINNSSYIEDQELTYSERDNRTFYFAYKEMIREDTKVVIEKDGNIPSLETNGNSDAVSFEEVKTSGDYAVYKITLGEKFETGWCDNFDFSLKLTRSDGSSDIYGLNLQYQRVGLVYAWPAWSEETDSDDYKQAPTWGFEKVGSHTNEKQVLYFGKMDADGNVTPVRNVSDITVDNGATIEKFEDGILGYYLVTLPKREQEYVFSCSGSTVRIHRDTPIIQFFKDEECKNEIVDYTFFAEEENSTFYVKIQELEAEWDSYQHIIMKEEKSSSETENLYFGKDYTDEPSELKLMENSPLTITQQNDEDNKDSEKIYKIEVEDSAPAQLGLRIKAKIHDDWTEDVTIQICKMKAVSDPKSTFVGANAEKVVIEETPQPDNLGGEGKESGLTEE